MLVLKVLLLIAAGALLVAAAAVLAYDLFRLFESRRTRPEGARVLPPPHPLRWQLSAKLTGVAWVPLLIALSIVVVPDGLAAVRISQISGTRPGTLYPGFHLIAPFIDRIEVYDVRDQVFSTAAVEPKTEEKEAKSAANRPEVLRAQAREGLPIGLSVTVRYRLNAQQLEYIHTNLPHPIDAEIVAPVVASAFRQVVPNFMVREVFATRREEIREKAAAIITERLAEDSIEVKEVMLRDLVLPAEYARGLEGLLLKEQENERMKYETQIKEKQVQLAELEAEAQKRRDVKGAEAAAQVHVLEAKAEADAMQYTLPLKQKQIEQSKLEADARKEATLRNAEAAAQAKVIDSQAELERRKLLAHGDAERIRLISVADAERLRLEAAVLKQNPLLIQKIIAEKLSDKIQIMMVPVDGKSFFVNDVLKSAAFGLPPHTETPRPNDP